MVVDICLTDPAATQAISTLRPVVEQSPPTADEGDLVESPSIAPRPSIYQALGVAAGVAGQVTARSGVPAAGAAGTPIVRNAKAQ